MLKYALLAIHFIQENRRLLTLQDVLKNSTENMGQGSRRPFKPVLDRYHTLKKAAHRLPFYLNRNELKH